MSVTASNGAGRCPNPDRLAGLSDPERLEGPQEFGPGENGQQGAECQEHAVRDLLLAAHPFRGDERKPDYGTDQVGSEEAE